MTLDITGVYSLGYNGYIAWDIMGVYMTHGKPGVYMALDIAGVYSMGYNGHIA